MKEIKVLDIVKTSQDQIGIVKEIITNRLDWFPYKVEILRDTVFNENGKILDFKESQLTKVI